MNKTQRLRDSWYYPNLALGRNFPSNPVINMAVIIMSANCDVGHLLQLGISLEEIVRYLDDTKVVQLSIVKLSVVERS